MNIVLTGLRGSGKSTIGKLLSQSLNWKFIDLDDEIEKHENKKISEIVSEYGWEYFRKKEKEITKKLTNTDKTVIATGGGTIIDPENEKSLKKNGRIIYLYEKPDICANRILNDPNRPPLTNLETVSEEIKQLYKERNIHYCQSAFMIFERTDNPEKDCKRIIASVLQKTQ